MNTPSLLSKIFAEFLGTFVLVFGGCGSAVLAASVVGDDNINMGIGFLGVALAFGLTVVVMAYAVGHISGGHFNPAVTLGAALAGRLPLRDAVPYWITQLIAGIAAGGVLLLIASGKPGFSVAESGFATNGYGDLSPNGYSLAAVIICEFVLTAIFLYVILGATDSRAVAGLAPLAIGLNLTLIHLVSIPVSNTSVNPARSFGVALFAGGEPLGQVWVFFLAPLAGAAFAGLTYGLLFPNRSEIIEERASRPAEFERDEL
ncbi:aquaporin Z [Brevibacterium luteolum]|uniref:aquaporin Z n=1 Tax=Brevibacterium luteolum TaxID=199591 RepID=UPI001C241A31|nr:aquaporin Z [Brevibacterium luteolum]MBU8579990.1 aquaporin Z [Brevibacterium luteolum]